MAESEVSIYNEAFQVIENADILDLNSFKDLSPFKKIELIDPFILKHLGKKLIYLSQKYQFKSLHSKSIGIETNVFVATIEREPRIFYNCSYAGLDNKISSVESCCFSRKDNLNFKNYFCVRYKKVVICGYEIVQLFEPSIEPIEVIFEGEPACVLQHEIDIQNLSLLPDYAEEVEVKLPCH